MRAAAASIVGSLVILAAGFLTPPSLAAEPAKLPKNRGFVTIGEIFRRSCSGCHEWASSYKGIAQPARIVALSPEETLLYRQVSDGSMPPEGPRLSAGELALIRAWIAAHAPPGDSPLVDKPVNAPYPSAAAEAPTAPPQPCNCGLE